MSRMHRHCSCQILPCLGKIRLGTCAVCFKFTYCCNPFFSFSSFLMVQQICEKVGWTPSECNQCTFTHANGNWFQSITEMYMEAHTVSHTRTRLKGDTIVWLVQLWSGSPNSPEKTLPVKLKPHSTLNQITHDATILNGHIAYC